MKWIWDNYALSCVSEGDFVGLKDGAKVGWADCELVAESVVLVGSTDGDCDGMHVGFIEGVKVGPTVGIPVGCKEGDLKNIIITRYNQIWFSHFKKIKIY